MFRTSLVVAAAVSLGACAGSQPGGGAATPIDEDQVRLHVVNEYESPVEVYFMWEGLTTRTRLGTVSIGREADFGVPWLGGDLRILFESPVAARTFTSNSLAVSEADRHDELIVTLSWSSQALLRVRGPGT